MKRITTMAIEVPAQDSNNVAGMGYTSILHKNDNPKHAKNYLLQISYVRLCKQQIFIANNPILYTITSSQG